MICKRNPKPIQRTQKRTQDVSKKSTKEIDLSKRNQQQKFCNWKIYWKKYKKILESFNNQLDQADKKFRTLNIWNNLVRQIKKQ